ncbi:MAG TPA: hypothetical protein V6D14_30330 [Coleofasciculaceae cyanobacterium]
MKSNFQDRRHGGFAATENENRKHHERIYVVSASIFIGDNDNAHLLQERSVDLSAIALLYRAKAMPATPLLKYTAN